MAKLVGVYNTAHTPFCFMPPENWDVVRSARPIRTDVYRDNLDESKAKSQRIRTAFDTLKAKLAEARPDVIVIFGDDQMECFDFRNFPSFAVYVGEEFEGALSTPEALAHDAFDSVGVAREGAAGEAAAAVAASVPVSAGPARARIKGHPGLATAILLGLMERGFDPAFCMDMPKPEEGVGHAFMRPAESLTDLHTPIVPILLNCYYAPQVTGMRSYQMGRAIRQAIDGFPEDLRVAVLGSGGLWHTPGATGAWLDEDFDRKSLEYMQQGNIKGMAEHFDGYTPPAGDTSQPIDAPRGEGATGMPQLGGPVGGTRETCNWIAASAVADGKLATLIDYVPVYASPIGCGFAYWPEV
jgi:3-O-methylgallate 3,4-dioxygenase